MNILIIVTFLIPCTQWSAWQGIELIVTSTTVPRSEGDAKETGEDNSGRRDGVFKSVGFKHINNRESY